jgi:acyl-CoA reductase-like NAD-dependent aldehyde dehydrogenase
MTRRITAIADGRALGEVTELGVADVPALVAAAKSAYAGWGRLAAHARADALAAAAVELAGLTAGLAPLHAAESGKVMSQARGEIAGAARMLSRNAELCRYAAGEVAPTGAFPGGEDDLTIVERVPLGVVVAVIPFNFPVELAMEKAGAALAAGNTVIVKLPPQNPLATRAAVEAVATRLPEGVLQAVFGDNEFAAALCAAPGVAAVSLTGSVGAGIAVASATARLLRPLHLELGGNGAAIVLPDADLDLVVSESLRGRLLMNGQACAATKRIIAHADIAADLTERFAVALSAISPSDPLDADARLGPLIDARAAARVEAQVQNTIAAGARRVLGGAPDGAWFAPTLLAGVPASAAIVGDDEVFGPVFPIIEVASEQEALTVANATSLRLTAAVFSADWPRAVGLAQQLDFGGVVVNGTNNYRPPVVPFGGVELAGAGREGFGYAMDELSRTRFIALRRIRGASR